ncbi:MAG: ribonuclease III [Lutibacter sp.]
MNFIRKFIKPRYKKDETFLHELKELLGFKPNDLYYYKKAFIHRSNKEIEKSTGLPLNYERLEFLGDAILSAVIATHLFKEVPSGDEGYLTQMRAKIVSREHLNELGQDLNLLHFVRSKLSKSKFGVNIYGNVFEALIGAIYLDKGYRYSEHFIHEKVINSYVNIKQLENLITSYKSIIIEWCQKQKIHFEFDVYEDSGNDPIKHFSVRLKFDGAVVSKGRATSKKKAEEVAAKRAYYAFQQDIENQDK